MKNIRSRSKYAVLPLAIFLLGSLLAWAQAATSAAECRASTVSSTRNACCNQPGRTCVSGQLRPLPQSTRATLTPNHWNGAPSHAGTSFAQPAGRARHSEISGSLTY